MGGKERKGAGKGETPRKGVRREGKGTGAGKRETEARGRKKGKGVGAGKGGVI